MKKGEIFPFRILILILINLSVTSAYSAIPAGASFLYHTTGASNNLSIKILQPVVVAAILTVVLAGTGRPFIYPIPFRARELQSSSKGSI